MMKTMIVDDHAIVAQGLSLLLSNISDIEILEVAKNAEEALASARKNDLDLVFLDLYLGDSTGLQVTRRLLQINPRIKIIIITAELSDLLPFRLLEAGALGYLHKSTQLEALKQAISAVRRGERYLSPMIAQRFVLSKTGASGFRDPFSVLSKREMEVMLMMVQGNSAQDISEQLHISIKTVHTHRASVLDKVGVKNDVELTIKAIQEGILSVQSSDSL